MLFSEFNTPTLDIIAGTECIGDSLYKINTNAVILSSFVVGMQSDIVAAWEVIQSTVGDAEGVLFRVQTLSAQTNQWEGLQTFVANSSSFLFTGFSLATGAVSMNVLLSTLRGNRAVFTGMSAVNLTATNIKCDSATTAYLSSRNCAVDSISSAGFYYGNGSKLTGIIAPTRVYVRFNGNTVNLPDSTQIPTGYWGTSFNVSSITKISTGIYKINFARSIEDYKYAYFLCSGGGTTPYVACRAPNTNASTYDITVLNKRLSDSVTVDAEEMNVMIMYPQSV